VLFPMRIFINWRNINLNIQILTNKEYDRIDEIQDISPAKYVHRMLQRLEAATC
jgi:hypothetical protein